MSVWYCSRCGMEDTRSHAACPSCNSALQVKEIEWLSENEKGAEAVFELETTPEEKGAIVDALMSENIRHRWEGAKDLVVAESDGDHVDGILDEILGEEEDDDSEDGDNVDEFEEEDMEIFLEADPYGTASEDGYEILSRLFIATGDIMKNRNDADNQAEFAQTAKEVLAAGTPFGIDEEMWADIQSAARNTSVAIANDSHAPVDGDLKGLHNLLQTLV